MRRFLDRIHALASRVSEAEPSEQMRKLLAKTVQKVTADTDRFKFNTALSALMVCVRDMEAAPEVSRKSYRELLRLAAPYAPHLAEHLWEVIGGEGSVHQAAWPEADSRLLIEDTVPVIVQIGGKKKGEVMLSPTASEAEALAAVREAVPAVESLHEDVISRVVYVPGRILNLVISGPPAG